MKNVLIIDDNQLCEKLLSDILTSLGYSVTLVQTGAAAISLLKQKGVLFSFIIMDIYLPDINGICLARQIKKFSRYKNVKIIGVSAFDMVNEKKCCGEKIFSFFLKKPINVAYFIDIVDVLNLD